jgi:hypothetical protein
MGEAGDGWERLKDCLRRFEADKSAGFKGDGGRGADGGEACWADDEDDEDGDEARGGEAEGEQFMLPGTAGGVDYKVEQASSDRHRDGRDWPLTLATCED